MPSSWSMMWLDETKDIPEEVWTKVLESKIEKEVCAWAEANGWLTYKLSGLGAKGKPDRVFLRASKAVFVEFKKPNAKPSELQRWHQRRLLRVGIRCIISSNVQEVIAALTKEDV